MRGKPESEIELPQCPYCGEEFRALKDGLIPTHDFPKPCRSVCKGSKEEPRVDKDTPLWKDDPQQQERDFVAGARRELLIYGFAVVKQIALLRRKQHGDCPCPLCGNVVRFVVAESNGHCSAKCKTENCISAME